MSAECTATHVISPTSTGSASTTPALRCAITAPSPTPASTSHTSTGRHHDPRAIDPAQAKQARSSTRMPTTSAGLSAVPRIEIARSATAPGASLMTSSATATTGDSRMVSTIAVA